MIIKMLQVLFYRCCINAIKSRQFLKNILEYELLFKMAGNVRGIADVEA